MSDETPPPPEKFPPAVAGTIDWLERSFGQYYQANPPPMPDRFTRREFGFILWPERPGPPPFLRHRAYTDADKFHWYLGKRGPHSIYYSTAYYRRPGEKMMVDKEWLGAELIFDLDADHLAEAEAAKAAGKEMPLEEQLGIVKRQFQYLLDEFLFGDFGLDEKDVFLTFSGGRGYHAHVTDPRLMDLDAKGRREIVDYVTAKVPAAKGSDLPDLSPFITEKPVGTTGMGKFQRARMAQYVAPLGTPGWPGRLTQGLVTTLQENVLDVDKSAAREWLLSLSGVGPKKADEFLDSFDAGDLERIGQGYLEQGNVVKQVSHHVLRQAALPLSKGETDEPVTADTKRLIRLPGSLHGKTGLKVVTLSVDDLKDFDPFRDAVGFTDGTVRMVPRFDQELTLNGDTAKVTGGEEVDVPMAHAVFWCSRQQGTIVS